MRAEHTYPCGTPKPVTTNGFQETRVDARELMGPPVEVRPITRVKTLEELFLYSIPSFAGGASLRNCYRIADYTVGQYIPNVMTLAGPVTASNQHRSWVIPWIELGFISCLSITDATCYHDGHDSLETFPERPIREVEMYGRDLEYKKEGVIRITNIGFPDEILYKQDGFFSTVLRQPEFQRKMPGTEFRNLLGKYLAAQEEAHGVEPGLLSTCWRYGVPIFVGAPGDGSVFLNHLRLWVLSRLGKIDHRFELDIEEEVFEFCAYHYWGLFHSPPRRLAISVLGGGVPKNFGTQPEPMLSQGFFLEGIRGYDCDFQIVSPPQSDGSCTSCPPDEAVTWGKVAPDALGSRTESLHTDYTTVMPFIARAIVEKRERFELLRGKIGEKKLFERHPEACGYLRPPGGYRLFDHRDEIKASLWEALKQPGPVHAMMQSMHYPIAIPD